MGSQRVRQDWVTEQQTELRFHMPCCAASKHINKQKVQFPTSKSIQFSAVAQLCPTYPMDYCTPGFLVLHYLPELAQTHVHQVGDAIQPSHPLSSPSPPTFNLSWNQGLFQLVSSLHQVAKVLEFSASTSVPPMNIQDWFPVGLTGLILQSKGLESSQHHSSKASILWCSAFFMAQLSHPYMTTGKTTVLTRRTFVGKAVSLAF